MIIYKTFMKNVITFIFKIIIITNIILILLIDNTWRMGSGERLVVRKVGVGFINCTT